MQCRSKKPSGTKAEPQVGELLMLLKLERGRDPATPALGVEIGVT
jgi:hypothetical protein